MKALKTIMVAMIFLMIVGCGSFIQNSQIQKALELCKNNGGLNYIYMPNNEEIAYAICNNGAEFRTDLNNL